MAILIFLKTDINFIIMCDKSARQPKYLEEEHLSIGRMVELCCNKTAKHDTKVDIHVEEQRFFEEQLILNLITSH